MVPIISGSDRFFNVVGNKCVFHDNGSASHGGYLFIVS